MAVPLNSVAVAAGSLIVTGYATTFVAAEGDLFVLDGFVALIASRDSASQLTLRHAWSGPSRTEATAWEIAPFGPYWRSTSTTNRQLSALLARFSAGPVKFDAVGTLAERSAQNGQGKGFTYLAIDPEPWQIFVKLANTNSASDWSSGQSLQVRVELTSEAQAARDAAASSAATAGSGAAIATDKAAIAVQAAADAQAAAAQAVAGAVPALVLAKPTAPIAAEIPAGTVRFVRVAGGRPSLWFNDGGTLVDLFNPGTF